MDYVLVDKWVRVRLSDVNVSDHFLVEARLRVDGIFKRGKKRVGGKNVIRVSELGKEECV